MGVLSLYTCVSSMQIPPFVSYKGEANIKATGEADTSSSSKQTRLKANATNKSLWASSLFPNNVTAAHFRNVHTTKVYAGSN